METWKEELILCMGLALPEAQETAKGMLFHYLIGERGRELRSTLMSDVTTADRTVGRMIAKIDEHCTLKVNETVKRYLFFLQEIKAQMKQLTNTSQI